MILRDGKKFIDGKASEKVAAGEAAAETVDASGLDVSVVRRRQQGIDE